MANNNLLNFVNNASSSIQDALGKPPKKMRVVNVRKFVQGRVKRLDNGCSRVAAEGNSSTKSKSALRKTHCPSTRGSCTWPDISSCNATPHLLGSSVPSVPSLAEKGISTYGYSTASMSTTLDMRSYSEPNLCLSPSSQPIDTELENITEIDRILSSLAPLSDPLSRCSSFGSVFNTSCTPPSAGNPEVQMYPTEQPFSPYSDISTDDLDSAYSSPIENVRLSYNCSPTSFTTIASNNLSLPTWTSPLNSSTDWLPAVTSNCMQEMGGISSPACDWMSSNTLTTSAVSVYDQGPPLTTCAVSVYDQGPPMTPTVSQLLEQYNQC